ncbi:hypothetical protein VMT65_35960 [Nocardia sp. CDC153]|uniref:hypothetical protein n=1 Tax=Nocardia sp. CDC153 TaxID=3112167 RepID=UPI002DBE5B8C|nr:hypothetical protein [Nocardia sp. CDC153]MEC3958476.1 hypothetical protein [Nocardia sp. CDC153]
MEAPTLRRAGIVAVAVLVAVVVVLLGWAIPPRAAVVSTDRLGPESGEAVSRYLDRARESLRGDDGGGHWALLSFTQGVTADRIPEFSGGLRISQVLYHVAVDRVATPIVAIGVPDGERVAVESVKSAAAQMESTPTFDDRSTRVARLVAARLRGDCACVVGIVLQGNLEQLRHLGSQNGVRAVQALPADASAGVFAVSPLLPEQVESASPGADDGPVPDN